MKRLLVISHDATLTGAPILLLSLLRLVKDGYRIEIILKRGGILQNEFKAIGKVVILKSKTYSSKKSSLFMLLDRLSYFFMLCKAIPLVYSCDIIISNTIANGRLLKYFRFFHKPIITYVHELSSVMQSFSKSRDTQNSLSYSNLFLFPSEAVKINLKENYYISDLKLKYFPYYFDSNKFTLDENLKNRIKYQFLNKWGIPDTAKLIAGMGSVSKRKGTDKFIQIAREIIAKDENAYFFWIGDFTDEEFATEIKEFIEIKTNQNTRQLIFTGGMPYSNYTLLPFDLFFLSSIEDPYPLVVLEASLLKVPTVCYENSGGCVELLQDGAGFILSDSSHESACEEIYNLLQNKIALVQTGNRIYKKVMIKHTDSVKTKNIFNEIINFNQ